MDLGCNSRCFAQENETVFGLGLAVPEWGWFNQVVAGYRRQRPLLPGSTYDWLLRRATKYHL